MIRSNTRGNILFYRESKVVLVVRDTSLEKAMTELKCEEWMWVIAMSIFIDPMTGMSLVNAVS